MHRAALDGKAENVGRIRPKAVMRRMQHGAIRFRLRAPRFGGPQTRRSSRSERRRVAIAPYGHFSVHVRHDRRLPCARVRGLAWRLRASLRRYSPQIHPEERDAPRRQGVSPARRQAGERGDAVPARRQHLGRTCRCELPDRPLRPARVHPRRRRLRGSIYAGRHAGDRIAARVHAGADDLRGRRPLHPAGGWRLWRDERLQRRRAKEISSEVHRPAAGRRGDRARNVLGLKGVYYSHDFSRHGYARNLDHVAFAPFWEKVAGFGLSAFVELSATPHYDRASYIANLLALDRVMQRHRALRFVLVMGPPVAHFARDGRWEFPAEVLAAYRRENLLIEIMFPITWGGTWDYPYPQAQALIRHMRELFGAAKLVWGSDMPNVERFCTYRQCLDYVRRYCTFFSAGEKK